MTTSHPYPAHIVEVVAKTLFETQHAANGYRAASFWNQTGSIKRGEYTALAHKTLNALWDALQVGDATHMQAVPDDAIVLSATGEICAPHCLISEPHGADLESSGLGNLIWEVSQQDEATVSATGASILAKAIISSQWLAHDRRKTEQRAAATAVRAYADTLGVDITDDHDDSEWWAGYRAAQRSFIHQTVQHAQQIEEATDDD